MALRLYRLSRALYAWPMAKAFRTSASVPKATLAGVRQAVAIGHAYKARLVGNRRCGIKDSGLGYKEDKEGVQEAMKSFTNVKTYSLPWA